MPSHPVKWYSSAMPGAPLLRNVAGDVINVLDWCLVNGSATTAVQSIVVASNVATVTFASAHTFQKHQIAEIAGVTGVTSLTLTFAATGIADGTAAGTITCKTPGLGWGKPFTGTNKAAYRSSDVQGTRFYLRVDDATATQAAVTGYESMTDVDTGSFAFRNVTYDQFVKSNIASAAPWWLVGDSRTFYYCCVPSAGTTTYGHGFGDVDDFVQLSTFGCFLAAQKLAQGGHSSVVSSGGQDASVIARARTGASGAVSVVRASPLGYNGQYPNPTDGGMRTIGPVLIAEQSTGNCRARMRGALDCIPGNGPAVGTILDSSTGYPGIALILASGEADYRANQGISSGNRRGAFDLVGPW